MKNFYQDFKLGILGGGQLGKMLLQAAMDFSIKVKVLDPDKGAPCKDYTREFISGQLTDFDTVVEFGKDLQMITIEIENVNTDALEFLEKRGVKIYPQPHIIKMIQDKRLQKQFFTDNDIPTSDFLLLDSKEALLQHRAFLPAVQKLAKNGYDGRGVHIIKSPVDFSSAFEEPSLLEKFVDFEKEISVIVARNYNCEVKIYPPVEMCFDKEHSILDYLISPANLDETIVQQANDIARQIVESLDYVGLLAIEMFVTAEGKVIVNEIAPRPHNSGHQTIEGNYTSQYQQLIRAILNLPLGETGVHTPTAMINLLGEEGYSGKAVFLGIEKILALEGVNLHIYGKRNTKPTRKMGHVSIADKNPKSLLEKIDFVKKNIRVVC